MSAFRIPFASLDAMLTFAASSAAPMLSPLTLTIPGDAPCGDGDEIRINFVDPAHCTDAGRILLDANAESLAALYGADSESAREAAAMAELYEFVPFAELPTPQTVIGAAGCFAYQASNHDGWTMSVAQWLTLKISERAAMALAAGHWGVDDNPARGDEPSPELAPAPEGEAPAATRAALLARLNGDTPAADDAPADDTPVAPTPEPELVAALERKGDDTPPESTSSHTIALSDIIAGNEARAAKRKARAAELKAAKAKAPKHDEISKAVVPPAKGKRSKAAAPTAA